ncbi:hypothetical protein MJD09_01095 [bacterium]|nr:hypothetical protein [bacterium]
MQNYRTKYLIAAALSVALLAAPIGFAQTLTIPVVEVDLGGRVFKSTLPFDIEFHVKGPAPKTVERIEVKIPKEGKTLKSEWKRRGEEKNFILRIPQLEHNHNYVFRFKLIHKRPPQPRKKVEATLVEIRNESNPNTKAIFRPKKIGKTDPDKGKTYFVETPFPDANSPVPSAKIDGPIQVSGRTRATLANYLNFEVGAGYAPGPDYSFLFTSIHFLPVPFNSDTKIKELEGEGHQLIHSVSFFVGLAVKKLHSGKEIENLSSFGNPVVGIGIRNVPFNWSLLDPIRFNLGVIWLKDRSQTPFKSTLKRTHFFSLSLDFDLQDTLGSLATIFQ